MRKFSEIEKETIKRLVDGADTSTEYKPIKAFDEIVKDRSCVGFDKEHNQLLFYYKGDDAPEKQKMLEVIHTISERALLIDYLIKDGMIYYIPTNTTPEPSNHCGDEPHEMNSISIAVDNYIADILYSCMNYPIYVKQTLKTYVHDGFLSLEEQSLNEAKKQTAAALKQTWLSISAVVIAAITMLIGIVQGCSSSRATDIPVSNMLNYMKNNIENKLDAIQENTANIKTNIVSNSGDTVIVKCCHCRYPHNPSTSPCIKRIKVNTCRDTVVSKESVK